MGEPEDQLAKLEERAWASFAQHSGQRLTTFNFFIVLSSLLVNAMVATFQKDFRVPYLGAVIGGLLAALSFIFWKIDVRNVQLIKIAESVIKYFEKSASVAAVNGAEPHPAAYFSREEFETARLKQSSPIWYFSYSRAFRWVYSLVALAGIAGAIVSIVI